MGLVDRSIQDTKSAGCEVTSADSDGLVAAFVIGTLSRTTSATIARRRGMTGLSEHARFAGPGFYPTILGFVLRSETASCPGSMKT